MTVSLVEFLNISALGDARGQLVVCENMRNVPFDIKRVYYLTGTIDGVSRGFHAHKELEQVAVCVSGKCLMVLDDGQIKEEVWLDSPLKVIKIDRMVWHEMHYFSADCVLLVMASDYYDEADYIRDYSVFSKLRKVNDG